MEVAALIERVKAGDVGAQQEVLARASRGCIFTQRAMIDALLSCGPADAGEMIRAEFLARMSAARGDPLDVRRLGSVLWLLANAAREDKDEDAAQEFAREAYSKFSALADRGDNESLEALAALGPAFPEALDDVERGADRTACPALVVPSEPMTVPLPWLAYAEPEGSWEQIKASAVDRYWRARAYLWGIRDALAILWDAVRGK
jgi:hypothetical protein